MCTANSAVRSRHLLVALVVAAVLSMGADSSEVLVEYPADLAAASLREIFATTTDPRRASEVLAKLAGQPVPADLSRQLDATVEWPARPSGIHQYQWSDVECGLPAIDQDGWHHLGDPSTTCRGKNLNFRSVAVRVPHGYDPRRSWPLLLLALDRRDSPLGAIVAAERQLGPAIDEWVVAAPHHLLGRHQPFLAAMRRTFHLDAGRTVAVSWGVGAGYEAWYWVSGLGDELAAAVVVDSSYPPPAKGPIWAAFAPKGAAVPVLSVWGSLDRRYASGPRRRDGSVRDRNRGLSERIGRDLRFRRWQWVEIEGRNGGDPARVDPSLISRWLSLRREPSPDEIPWHAGVRGERLGPAWWLRPLSAIDSGWNAMQPNLRRPGEGLEDAFLREFREGMPWLDGRRTTTGDGVERIEVDSHLVEALAIHFECDRLDAPRVVSLVVDGAEVFRGPVSPSLPIALLEARRTRDFDRLTCAILARANSAAPWRVVAP